ncbi:MAG: ABC transporter permease [Clostridia bacterium]|nr:ABC transporter permease [Clostridia bacterium]
MENNQGTRSRKQYKRRSALQEVWRRFRKNPGAMLGLFMVILIVGVAIASGFIFDYQKDVVAQHITQRLKPPSAQHWFGTDQLGRDIFARVLYGARYSLSIGLIAVCVSLIVGVTLGAIAGYVGGIVENIIMRVVDIFLAIPSILLAIAVVSALGQSALNLMIAVGLCTVPSFAQVARASVLTVRNNEYVEASRAIGATNWQVIRSHILPNSLSPIIVQATLRIGSAIISASALSFLGLGIPLPAPEWGAMLSEGRQYIRDYSYMTLFPGLAILLTVISFNLIGDGLRDAIDPKLKR